MAQRGHGHGSAVRGHDRSARLGLRGRVAVVLAAMLALSGLSAVGMSTVTAAPAAAAAEGCGYANTSANNGAYASTICWFDFTAFNETQARTTAGQPMQVTLDGGYVAKFTVKLANVSGYSRMGVERRATPLETRFAFGTDAYRGVPGLHTLYSFPAESGTTAAKLSFENIEIVDSVGNTVSGYSFVAADTEDNVSSESFIWSSDTPMTEIERLAPNGGWGCKNPQGLGTTEVRCSGTGVGATSIAGGKSTALLVAADSPTFFATQWATPARSAIAIGIQTAKLTLTKQVQGRINTTDSFDVAVRNEAGSVAGQASTGTNASASTGAVNVVAGGAYTLEETVTSGSPVLSNYDTSWSCVNRSASSTTLLPSGSGTSKSVVPAVGDDITCTVTNTAKSVGITLQKNAATPVDVNGNGITDVGDTIMYTFAVTNSGQTGLERIAVQDPKIGTVTCPPGTVAPDSTVTCSADAAYAVTADDLSAGAVNNSATATGFPIGADTPVTSDPSTTSTPTTAPAPDLSIVKSASPSDAASYTEGQLITYSFVVTNTGNVPLSNVAVMEGEFTGTGELSPIVCPPGSDTLAAGAQATCTATYTLTQQDVDNGSVTNSATATGTPGDGDPIVSPPSEARLPVDPAPGVSLTKTATPNTANLPGTQITYRFAVTNSGNVSLSDATVAETAFSGTGATPTPSCPTGVFRPGETVTCTATYELTQADVNAGTVTNTAVAGATASNGADPQSEPSSAVVDIPAGPALSLVKSAATDGSGIAGDEVTYSFLVTNTGNVTLDDVAIEEGDFSGTGELGPITCPATMLDAGDETTCTATYRLTQADVDAGEVTNSATATAMPFGDTDPVSSGPSEASVTTDRTPTLTLVKTAAPTVVETAGETVTYSFQITNTGSVTLTDPRITETAFSGTGLDPQITCPTVALKPTDTITCTASYTVTQADVDSGTITNTATATATPPAGLVAPVSDPSTATVTAEPAPALTLVKSAAPSAPAYFSAGQRVTYSFVVTNTGNVTLTDVHVQEGEFTGSGTLPTPTCPDAADSLAPGEQVVCSTEYTVTQADVDAGSITNAATATGTPPGPTDPPESPSSEVTIPDLADPAITLVKTSDAERITHAGQIVTYSFTATNAGNTTLTDAKIVEGAFTGAGTLADPVCPAVAQLVPGERIVCTATYTVVSADLTGTPLVNTATATAAVPGGGDVASDPSTARIEDVALPPRPADPLASTGYAIAWGVGASALGLIAAGAILLAIRRRRRTA